MARGELVARPDLVRGLYSDFAREGLDDQFMIQVHPENTMHPILPLHVEAAWSDASGPTTTRSTGRITSTNST